jgi:hypothetical protein
MKQGRYYFCYPIFIQQIIKIINMKELTHIILILVTGMFFASCEKDETDQCLCSMHDYLSEDVCIRHDFYNWPGKNNSVKTNVEIKENLVSPYNLGIDILYDDYITFISPRDETDPLKFGRLVIAIYSSCCEAQLSLLTYLREGMASHPKNPERLTIEDFKYGDVAFGYEYDGMFTVFYTKNNVRVVLVASIQNAMLIANEISQIIQDAPVVKKKDTKPKLIFTKE